MANYREMTDGNFKAAVRDIISSSSSEDEVRERVRKELGYPYSIALCTHLPQDDVGREARAIVRALGGLVMKNGAMARAMVHGHEGVI